MGRESKELVAKTLLISVPEASYSGVRSYYNNGNCFASEEGWPKSFNLACLKVLEQFEVIRSKLYFQVKALS